MGDKVGIGIIGCGVIGKGGHIRRYLNNPQAKIVAVADIREERAKEAAELAGGAAWYTDYHDLLKREDVQGVSICTPHPVHAEPAIAAADAGKHILCEKPMCVTVQQANAMAEAVKRNKVKFQMGYQTHFSPSMQMTKRLIEEGYLGRIHQISSIGGGHQDGNQDADWFYSKWAGGGVTLDWTTYTVYQFRFLMGPVKSVYAESAINQEFKKSKDRPGELVKMEVEDTISMLIRFESGAMGLIYGSWSSPTGHGYSEIVGFDGVMASTPLGTTLYTNKTPLPDFAKEGKIVLPGDPPRFDAYQARVDHFVDCILNDKEPVATIELGHDVVEICEAAYRSIAAKQAITLPLEA
jgi:predicted dehydrogenase